MKALLRIRDIGLRSIAGGLSPAGPRAKLLILTYHRILPWPDELLPEDLDVSRFEWQMEILKRYFTVLPLIEAAARMAAGELPSRAVCITFDDGYADNFEVALPILLKYGLPATFFIAAGFIGGGRMWNDTVIEAVRRVRRDRLDLRNLGLEVYSTANVAARARTINKLLGLLKYLDPQTRSERVQQLADTVGEPLPERLMMTAEQLQDATRRGIEIGAHTVTHPILTRLPAVTAAREIAQSRERLRAVTGAEVTAFAYPNGKPGADYNSEHVEAVRRAGFRLSVTTAWGCASAKSDPLQLPRIAPWDPTPSRFTARMLRTYFNGAAAVVQPVRSFTGAAETNIPA